MCVSGLHLLCYVLSVFPCTWPPSTDFLFRIFRAVCLVFDTYLAYTCVHRSQRVVLSTSMLAPLCARPSTICSLKIYIAWQNVRKIHRRCFGIPLIQKCCRNRVGVYCRYYCGSFASIAGFQTQPADLRLLIRQCQTVGTHSITQYANIIQCDLPS